MMLNVGLQVRPELQLARLHNVEAGSQLCSAPWERDAEGAGKGYIFSVTQGCLLAFKIPRNQMFRQENAWFKKKIGYSLRYFKQTWRLIIYSKVQYIPMKSIYNLLTHFD